MTKTNKKGVIIIVVFFAIVIPLVILAGIFAINKLMQINTAPKQAMEEFMYSNEEFIEEYGEGFKYKVVSFNITTYSSETKSGHAEYEIKIGKTRYSFELEKTDGKWEVIQYKNIEKHYTFSIKSF